MGRPTEQSTYVTCNKGYVMDRESQEQGARAGTAEGSLPRLTLLSWKTTNNSPPNHT
jgi:hypothetical protein